ncbi:MAG: hypothetical protein Q7P63_12895 [Verrucomicrobiota bacterium JB022]|nr:hypothetical protein [Verrucomicrobiota bacterium JB022]
MTTLLTVFDESALLELVELEKLYLELYPRFIITTPKPMVDIGWPDFADIRQAALLDYDLPFGMVCNRVHQPSVQPTIYLKLKQMVPQLSILTVVVYSSLGWTIVPYEKRIARGFVYEGHHSLEGAVFSIREHLQGVEVC